MKKYSIIANYRQMRVLMWLVVIFILWSQLLDRGPFKEVTITLISYITPLILLNTYLSNYLLPKAIRRKNMHIFMIQFVLLTIAGGFVNASILFFYSLLEAWGYFAPSTLFVNPPSLLTEFRDQLLSTLIINLAFCGIRFYYEHAKLEKINLEYQLQTLRSQITPHFMFNVLNHIHILMEYDVELASSLLIKYSDILRYQLYNGENEEAELEQEVHFLRNFTEIEKIRWGNKLEVECTWKIENNKMKVPALLFITFVENAFKHVSRPASEKGFIRIYFEQKGNRIRMEIVNSITDSPTIKRKEGCGLGLQNIRKRLDILYKDKYTLEIKQSESTYHSVLTIYT